MFGSILILMLTIPFIILMIGNSIYDDGWLLKYPKLFSILKFYFKHIYEHLRYTLLFFIINITVTFFEFKTKFVKKEIKAVKSIFRYFKKNILITSKLISNFIIKRKDFFLVFIGCVLIIFSFLNFIIKIDSYHTLWNDVSIIASETDSTLCYTQPLIDIDQIITSSGKLKTNIICEIKSSKIFIKGIVILRPIKAEGYKYKININLQSMPFIYESIQIDRQGRKLNEIKEVIPKIHQLDVKSKFCIFDRGVHNPCLYHEIDTLSMNIAVKKIKQEMEIKGFTKGEYIYKYNISATIISPEYITSRECIKKGYAEVSCHATASFDNYSWKPVEESFYEGFVRSDLRYFIKGIPYFIPEMDYYLTGTTNKQLNEWLNVRYSVKTPWEIDHLKNRKLNNMNANYKTGLSGYGKGNENISGIVMFEKKIHDWILYITYPLGFLILGIGIQDLLKKLFKKN